MTMTLKSKLKYFCWVSGLLLCFSSFNDAKADSAGFSVDTSVVMLRINPGKELPFSFTITNRTGYEQTVHLEERDISIGDENIVTFLSVEGGPSRWVTFQQNDFVLADGKSQTINASVQVPEEQEGGVKMMTMVSFFSQESSMEAGPKVSGNIGVYTILSGKEMHNASGKFESLSYPKFISSSIDVSAAYSNDGDVQFVPQGKISVENLFTKERTEVPFDNHFVFPGKKVTFAKSISVPSSFGAYELKISFKDGNGSLMERTVYAMGKLFPISLLIFSVASYFIFRAMLKIRRKNNREVITAKLNSLR